MRNIFGPALLAQFFCSAQISVVQAQSEISCSVSDAYCLQRSTEVECREENATRQTCEAWLRRMESHPNSSILEWRIATGWIYMSMADFATVSALKDFRSVTEEEAISFRSQALNIFEQAVADAPNNSEALLSLSTVTEDSNARIELLKRTLAANPADQFAARSLASNLVAAQGMEGYLEAGEVYEAAYMHSKVVPQRWDLAENALNMYASSGNPDRADALKEKISAEIKFKEFESAFNAINDSNEILEFTRTICDSHIISIFDGEPCVKLLQLIKNDLLANSTGTSIEYAEGFASIASEASFNLTDVDTNISEILRMDINAIISSGKRSAKLYNAYANFLTGAEQQEALEQAIALDPRAGEIRYRLGLVYLEQGLWEKSIEQLEASRADLPEWRHQILEEQITRARQRQ